MYESDVTGCSAPPVSTPIDYSHISGGNASIPGVTDVRVLPGCFDDPASGGSRVPAIISINQDPELIQPLLPLAIARYAVVSHSAKIITITTTQQPKERLEVSDEPKSL